MKLLVGLGNPGPQYAGTRHNAGFMVIDRLAGRYGLTPTQSKFHSRFTDGMIVGQRCMLLLPSTFMNRSGLAVGQAMAFYQLPIQDLLVVVDDLALACGRLRLRGEGGAGGHNGLVDIERALGTRAYARLRVGIDQPPVVPQSDYVLSRFSADQRKKLDVTFERACDAIEIWLKEGIEKAMNLFNAE